MGDKTRIAWTDATWNPVRGCSRVSEGCRNCYAERLAARFSGPGEPYEGLAVLKDGAPRWTGRVRVVEERLYDPIRWNRPRRVFVNSMSDLFHEALSTEDIYRIFAAMRYGAMNGHVFQVLTKRPARMKAVVEAWLDGYEHATSALAEKFLRDRPELRLYSETKTGTILNSIWFGVSVEDQTTADERVPILLSMRNAVPWVSYEPALAPVSFWPWLSKDAPRRLAWIVYGGESGPGFRPDDPTWARLVYDQCRAAGVPFFYKQASGLRPGTNPKLYGREVKEYPE